ncbi:MAG: shikimate dehydrogenase [Chloroflexi bacterium]|nr:shikimate dehydrogenase [Chloroflexota bacterium]
MPRPSTFDFRLGLIGYPLGHSLSPKIHLAALKSCGLDGDYSLFPIHPDDKQGLKDLLERVRAGELQGLNVTIPHKQNVIPLLDELTPTARSIGAVNTIYLRENKLIGENTDAPGFLSDLNRFIGNRDASRGVGKSALVLGAGGAARAVVYALLDDGWNINVVARRLEQAQQLASSFNNYQLPITTFSDLQPSREAFNLLVNTTPIGMTPNTGQSPLPENLSLPDNAFIYDLVYNPRETKLVKDARAQGLNATTGLGMLIEQAALAFEIWTGHNPPRKVLWNTFET